MGGVGEALSGVGGAVGGIVGNANAEGNRDQQAQDLAKALAAYQNLSLPTLQEQQITPEMYKSAGELTPTLESTLSQGQSQLNSYQSNPDAMTAQMQALKQLQQIGQQGGLTATDKAQLNQITNSLNRQNASNQAAIQQQASMRGMAGSGLSQAQQLLSQQAGAQNASDQGFNVAAQAQQRALQAIQGAGSLGQGIENQQFGQAQVKAGQQNAINQFNTANAQNVQGQNVQRQNYGQQYNLQNNQNLANQNTGLQNQAQEYNKGLFQQNYNNQLSQAAGLSGQYNKNAAQQAAEAQRKVNLGYQVGSGIGKAAGGIGSAAASAYSGGATDAEK